MDNKRSNLFNLEIDNTTYLYKDSYHSILYLIIFGRLIPNFIIFFCLSIIIFIFAILRDGYEFVDTLAGMSIIILIFFSVCTIFAFLGYYLIKPYVYQIALKDTNLIISSVEYNKKREDTIDLMSTTIELLIGSGRLGITRDYWKLPNYTLKLKQEKKTIFEIKNFQGFFFGLRQKEVSALYKQLMILQKSLKNNEEQDQLTEKCS